MNTPVFGLRGAGVVFGLMGLAQVIRTIVRADLLAGSRHPSPWWSAAAGVAFAVLSLWFWRLATRAENSPVKPTA